MRTRILGVCAAGALLAAAGCSTHTIDSGSHINKGPVGIGTGINELKGSPCACVEIPMTLPDTAKA